MNLYLATRFGTHISDIGPDGPDTHFLVRASDHTQASQLVDNKLKELPTDCIGGECKVDDFCHIIVEIAEEKIYDNAEIVTGPWVSVIYLTHLLKCRIWKRDDKSSEWIEGSD